MAFFAAFGRHLPQRVVDNAEIAALLGCDAQWITRVSGIEQRRFAEAGETVVDLAVMAAQDCLSRSDSRSVEMLIVASGTSDRRFPGPASAVARALGLGTIPAIDLPIPSAGALFAIAFAARLVSNRGQILVVAAEKMSTVVLRDPLNASSAILFGDGAGACLISAVRGMAAIVDAELHSDGAFGEELSLGFDGPLRMDGRTVLLQASRRLPEAILQVLLRNNVTVASVGAFLLHQANQNLTAEVARSLGIDSHRFFSNIRSCGNTSSASLLIAASEWAAADGFQVDVPVVLAAFGAGLHWGAVLARREAVTVSV